MLKLVWRVTLKVEIDPEAYAKEYGEGPYSSTTQLAKFKEDVSHIVADTARQAAFADPEALRYDVTLLSSES